MAKKTPPPQANNYIRALEEARRREDLTREEVSIRQALDRIEDIAADMAKAVKATGNTNPGSVKSAQAFKKMLEDTLHSMVPNTRAAYNEARESLKAVNEQLHQASELTERERVFLKSFSQSIEKEIGDRSNAWTRGMSALRKSFTGLDSDIKSLLVGATTGSPLLMIATKMLLRTKEEKADTQSELRKARMDREIALAKSRAEAIADMQAWVQATQGGGGTAPATGGGKKPRQSKAARQAAAKATPTVAPTQPPEFIPPAPPRQKTAQDLLDEEDDLITQRDLARDLAIEVWKEKNPGKDLDDSPFARQDKVWAQPRRIGSGDGVMVSDQPVKEAVEELTTVVASQTEPIRQSLHEDRETNDLLNRVLDSGERLADDMKIAEEERSREAKTPTTVAQDTSQKIVQAMSGQKKGGLFDFSVPGILTAIGLGGVVKTIGGLARSLVSGASGLGRGLMLLGRTVLSVINPVTKIAAAFGVGWAIGEGLEHLTKQFFGFSLKQTVSDLIGNAVARMVTDKEAGMRQDITTANQQRIYDAARAKRRTGDIELPSGQSSMTPERVGMDTLPITGVMSPFGQMITADTTRGSDTLTGFQTSVPMHATSPQVVAQAAMGDASHRKAKDWTVSPAGIAHIKREEAFAAKPYWDVNGYAIGYGMHEWKGQSVNDILKKNPKFTVTRQEADQELERQLNGRFRNAVANAVHVPLTQNQFDGLMSVAWNTGDVPRNLRNKLNKGESVTLADFQKSGTVNGVKHAGLQDRRAGEFQMFSAGPENRVAMATPSAARVVATNRLTENSQANRDRPNIVVSAPTVNAPTTNVAGGSSQPTVLVMPNARNPEPSLNALTRLLGN